MEGERVEPSSQQAATQPLHLEPTRLYSVGESGATPAAGTRGMTGSQPLCAARIAVVPPASPSWLRQQTCVSLGPTVVPTSVVTVPCRGNAAQAPAQPSSSTSPPPQARQYSPTRPAVVELQQTVQAGGPASPRGSCWTLTSPVALVRTASPLTPCRRIAVAAIPVVEAPVSNCACCGSASPRTGSPVRSCVSTPVSTQPQSSHVLPQPSPSTSQSHLQSQSCRGPAVPQGQPCRSGSPVTPSVPVSPPGTGTTPSPVLTAQVHLGLAPTSANRPPVRQQSSTSTCSTTVATPSTPVPPASQSLGARTSPERSRTAAEAHGCEVRGRASAARLWDVGPMHGCLLVGNRLKESRSSHSTRSGQGKAEAEELRGCQSARGSLSKADLEVSPRLRRQASSPKAAQATRPKEHPLKNCVAPPCKTLKQEEPLSSPNMRLQARLGMLQCKITDPRTL